MFVIAKAKKLLYIYLVVVIFFSANDLFAKDIELFEITAQDAINYSNSATSGIRVYTSSDTKLLQKGDTIQLIFESKKYTISVLQRVIHSNGDVTVQGLVDGKYQAVITRGNTGSSASIDTPDGKYAISQTSSGEYLRTPLEFNKLEVLPFANDALIPPVLSSFEVASIAESSQAQAPIGTASIDIMVLFTPELVSSLGSIGSVETRINQLISLTNQAYSDSNMEMELNLVHSEQINASNTADVLNDMTNGVGVFSSVSALRESKGADLVVLLRNFEYPLQTYCGVAWILGDKSTGIIPLSQRTNGYSVVHDGESNGSYCSDYTFAHEVGHNSGFAHDRDHAGSSGLFSYSYGHDEVGIFATIMSYDSPEIGKFSNPLILCNGSACGVAEGWANSADNARSGNNIRHDLAAFYDPVTLPSVSIMAIDDIASEDASVEGAGSLMVSRTGNTTEALSVILSFDGSAKVFDDYELPALLVEIPPPVSPGPTYYQLTIPSGEDDVLVMISPVDDGVDEGTEIAEINLQTSPDYISVSPFTSASISILDSNNAQSNESDATLKIGSVSGAPGAVVTLPVVFKNSALPQSEKGVVALEVVINYPDVLSLNSVDVDALGASSSVVDQNVAGKITIVLLKLDGDFQPLPFESGNILLDFMISDQASEGLYEISFGGNPIVGGEGGALSLEQISNGSVEVMLFEPGDSNGDGSINVLDIISLINIVFEGNPDTVGSDANSDGSVNVLDIIWIINKVFD